MADKTLNCNEIENVKKILDKILVLHSAVYSVFIHGNNFSTLSYRKIADLFADFAGELQDIAK